MTHLRQWWTESDDKPGFFTNYKKNGELKSFWHLVYRDIIIYGAGTIILILLFILVSWLL